MPSDPGPSHAQGSLQLLHFQQERWFVISCVSRLTPPAGKRRFLTRLWSSEKSFRQADQCHVQIGAPAVSEAPTPPKQGNKLRSRRDHPGITQVSLKPQHQNPSTLGKTLTLGPPATFEHGKGIAHAFPGPQANHPSDTDKKNAFLEVQVWNIGHVHYWDCYRRSWQLTPQLTPTKTLSSGRTLPWRELCFGHVHPCPGTRGIGTLFGWLILF